MLSLEITGTGSSAHSDSLPYTAPSLETILVLTSFLLLLPLFSYILRKVASASLLGPLLLGAIYARPLGDILPDDLQATLLQLGYLGLMLLIVQGGLEARLDILSNPKVLGLAIMSGATGVILPIGLSIALLPTAFGYGFLESFVIGAALSSTSLGTTFAVLSSMKNDNSGKGNELKVAGTNLDHDPTSQDRNSRFHPALVGDETGAPAQLSDPHGASSSPSSSSPNLVDTNVGMILIGAALLDDIIGLVISGVVANLGASGGSDGSLQAWTLARPIVSSFLLVTITSILCVLVIAPVTRFLARRANCRQGHGLPLVDKARAWLLLDHGVAQYVATFAFVSVTVAYSTISEEIGSSLLIGCFCAGGTMKFCYKLWSDEVARQQLAQDDIGSSGARRISAGGEDHRLRCIFDPESIISKTALGSIQTNVLEPFFFASIGAAIPVKSMFEGQTVWRGVIYAGLMGAAKVGAGAWLYAADWLENLIENRRTAKNVERHPSRGSDPSQSAAEDHASGGATFTEAPQALELEESPTVSRGLDERGRNLDSLSSGQVGPKLAKSWPPAILLGLALVARGEIGFLIINIARQGDLIRDEAFNVGIWAITLNTIAGPAAVGILMRTENGRSITGGGRWGAVGIPKRKA